MRKMPSEHDSKIVLKIKGQILIFQIFGLSALSSEIYKTKAS